MAVSFLAIVTVLVTAQTEATPVPTRIDQVTLYGSSAMVRRVGEVAGGGNYVVSGLPAVMDAENVRVRVEGGEVVDVEVRQRLQEEEPNARLEELRKRLEDLRREMKALADKKEVAETLYRHYVRLLDIKEREHQADLDAGKARPEVWSANAEYVISRLTESKQGLREIQLEIDALALKMAELERERSLIPKRPGTQVFDVHVDVFAGETKSPLPFELSYLVRNTGWQPIYDLRAASDLSGVELGYRARIWQRTDEDWNDVELVLSTARPQIGAQGPEPRLTWLELYDPKPRKARANARMAPTQAIGLAEEEAFGDGADDYRFAQVQQEGLSVRFRLSQRETIESRDQTTNVLVGRTMLELKPERYCVPSSDPTVWLRAEATNVSPWTLLPGRASVFFGDDFLGHAMLQTVHPEQDFTLHLGADSTIAVERKLIIDKKKGPGFLSSRSSRVERWQVEFKNHGAKAANPDGSVTVTMREAIPRSRDDRIAINLSEARPKPSTDERWKADQDELSIYTWLVRVPAGGASQVLYETTVAFPKGMEIHER